MAKKIHTPRTLALPTRHWAGRTSIVLMVACGLTLTVMSKTSNPAVVRLRSGMDDLIVPVLSVAARPMDALGNAGNWLHDIMDMQAENVALKNENAQLL